MSEKTYGQINGTIQLQADVINASPEKVEKFQNAVEKMLNDMMLFDIAEQCGFVLDIYTPATVEEIDYEEYSEDE